MVEVEYRGVSSKETTCRVVGGWGEWEVGDGKEGGRKSRHRGGGVVGGLGYIRKVGGCFGGVAWGGGWAETRRRGEGVAHSLTTLMAPTTNPNTTHTTDLLFPFLVTPSSR